MTHLKNSPRHKPNTCEVQPTPQVFTCPASQDLEESCSPPTQDVHVCTCACMCLCIAVHVCIYACVCLCVRAYVLGRVCLCVQVCACVCACIYSWACVLVHVCLCVCTCVHVCVCVFVCHTCAHVCQKWGRTGRGALTVLPPHLPSQLPLPSQIEQTQLKCIRLSPKSQIQKVLKITGVGHSPGSTA